MAKNLMILLLTVLFVSTVASGTETVGSNKSKPLMDGFVLPGVDGKLSRQDGNDVWFFEFDLDVGDDRGRICAGVAVELLPSAMLERMTADANGRSDASYRLWGRVTKYRGKNFIFPVYFLPLGKISERESPTPHSSQEQEIRPGINDPNNILTIPKELIEKLQTRRVLRTKQSRGTSSATKNVWERKKGLGLRQDSVLADRTGFMNQQDDGYELFVLDALGWRVQEVSLRLLPCQALEQAQQQQSAEPEQIRYKVAGIVTEYKGKRYLLLQRAIRVYSYGNFGR